MNRSSSPYDTLLSIAQKRGKAKKFKKNAAYIRTFGGFREIPKYFVVQMTDLIRRKALQLADTWIKEGRLEHRDQIFQLTSEQIAAAEKDDSLDILKVLDEHAGYWRKMKNRRDWPAVIDSRGKIFYPPRKEVKEGELAGVPISAGVVTGKVKVLHSADEKKLLPGEILVTRATDPGWTPLFINAGGIILEIGGALQHGAVVAREYGLPCVSGLVGATEMLQDGQMVEVDGSNGIVRILDGEKPA